VKKVLVNPCYTGFKDNFQYDIAMVFLKTRAVISPAVKPVNLETDYKNDEIVLGASATGTVRATHRHAHSVLPGGVYFNILSK